MSGLIRRSVLYNRIVLLGASLLFSVIALRYIFDPVGAVAPHHITLGSNEAMTIMRVTGATFLGFAIVLVTCALSQRRTLAGIGFLAIVALVLTSVRLLGLALDGPAPFTLQVLKPELLVTGLSLFGFYLETQRLRGPRALGGRLARDGV